MWKRKGERGYNFVIRWELFSPMPPEREERENHIGCSPYRLFLLGMESLWGVVTRHACQCAGPSFYYFPFSFWLVWANSRKRKHNIKEKSISVKVSRNSRVLAGSTLHSLVYFYVFFFFHPGWHFTTQKDDVIVCYYEALRTYCVLWEIIQKQKLKWNPFKEIL